MSCSRTQHGATCGDLTQDLSMLSLMLFPLCHRAPINKKMDYSICVRKTLVTTNVVWAFVFAYMQIVFLMPRLKLFKLNKQT